MKSISNNQLLLNILEIIVCVCLSIWACVSFIISADIRIAEILSVFIFIVAFYVIKKGRLQRTHKGKILPITASLLFTALTVAGTYKNSVANIGKAFVCTIGYLFFYYYLFVILLNYCDGITVAVKRKSFENSKRYFLYFFIIMILCWLPSSLCFYPAYTTQDSLTQLNQVTGQAPLSNWHPILHTMLIKATYKFGLLISGGNQNIGVAAYTVTQTVLMALIFSYFLISLYKLNVNKKHILLCLAFFSFFPIIPLYNMIMWKDILFAGVTLGLLTSLWKLIYHFKSTSEKSPPKDDCILFWIFSTGVCLLRSNGIYAYALLVPFLFIAFKKLNVKIAFIGLSSLLASVILIGPVFTALGFGRADFLEAAGVPLQHIASVISQNGKISSDEYKFISSFLSVDIIKSVFIPGIVDPLKEAIRTQGNELFIEENKLQFLKVWLSIGLKNPTLYIKAEIDQTVGFWFPSAYNWTSPWFVNEGFSFTQKSLLPQPFSILFSKTKELYAIIPILTYLWHIGAYTWLIFTAFTIAVRKKFREELILFVLPLAILLSLIIATPVSSEFRYAYSLVLCTPLLGIVSFYKKGEKKANE